MFQIILQKITGSLYIQQNCLFLQSSRWEQLPSLKRRENMNQVKFHSPSRIKLVASLSGLILTPISTLQLFLMRLAQRTLVAASAGVKISDHQHIMVCSDNPKQMEKTVKAFVRHEGKVLYQIRTRMFIPQSPLQTFINQFHGIGAVDVIRRGEQFEHFLRADELGLDKRTNEKMDIVWEIEKTCPVRPLQLTTLNEDQRRLLAKIESSEQRLAV